MSAGRHNILIKLIHRNKQYYSSALFLIDHNIRVAYHGVTSSFFGIGILPVSDLLGGGYFRSVLLIWHELLFPRKRGWMYQKGGRCPLFPQKGGRCPLFEGKTSSRQKKWYRNVPTEISFGIGMENTKKYRPIPTGKILIRYTTLHNMVV